MVVGEYFANGRKDVRTSIPVQPSAAGHTAKSDVEWKIRRQFSSPLAGRMRARRRTILRFLLSLIAWGTFSPRSPAAVEPRAKLRDRMLALAGAVLPGEVGPEGRKLAVEEFLGWVRDYRSAAELDHEYGSSRLGRTPYSPVHEYAVQFDDLDRRCGGDFAAASVAAQQRAVTEAVTAARVKELPVRPDGGHVATDLMAHFFNGTAANDLAYRHRIGRFDCRGLHGSEQRPPALGGP